MGLGDVLQLDFLGRDNIRETAAVRWLWGLRNSIGKFDTKLALIYMFLATFIIGVAYYMAADSLSFLDTFYFLTVLLGTVGYGDLYPSAKLDRWFTSFYVLIGIAIMTAMFAAQRELVASGRRNQLLQRAKKLGKEMRGIRETVRTTIAHLGAHPDEDMDLTSLPNTVEGGDAGGSVGGAGPALSKKNRRGSVKDMFMEMSTQKGVVRKVVKKFGRSNADRKLLHELESLNIEQYDDELMRIVAGFLYDVGMLLMFIFVGAGVMVGIEGWDYQDAVYWATMTVTTVGFGDLVPRTRGGKVFTIFYIIIAVVYITTAIADMAQYPVVLKKKRDEMSVVSEFGTSLTPEAFESLIDNDFYDLISGPNSSQDTRPSTYLRPSLAPPQSQAPPSFATADSHSPMMMMAGLSADDLDGRKVSKAEFVLSLLFMMDKVAEKDVVIASAVFDTLDVDKDGFLSQRDVEQDKEEIMQMDLERRESEAVAAAAAEPSLFRSSLVGGAPQQNRIVFAPAGPSDGEPSLRESFSSFFGRASESHKSRIPVVSYPATSYPAPSSSSIPTDATRGAVGDAEEGYGEGRAVNELPRSDAHPTTATASVGGGVSATAAAPPRRGGLSKLFARMSEAAGPTPPQPGQEEDGGLSMPYSSTSTGVSGASGGGGASGGARRKSPVPGSGSAAALGDDL